MKIKFSFLFILFLALGFQMSAQNITGQKNQSKDDILRNEVLNLQKELYKPNFVLLKKVSPKFYIFPIRVITFKGEKSNFVLAVFSTEFNVAVETGNTSCNQDNGFIKIYIEGGQPPYVVKIDNQIIASPWVKKDLQAGDYRVQVDDQVGNQYLLFKARVDESTIPEISLTFVGGSCGITATVLDGVPPYSFKWSNGATTKDLTNLISGTYKVTVTDGHNCTDTESILISCSTVTYSNNIISRKNCDSLSVLKLDTVKTGMKSFNTGLDSSNIFSNLFAKTYYKNSFSTSCDSSKVKDTVIITLYHNLLCDSLQEHVKVTFTRNISFGYISMPTCDSSLIGQTKTAPQVYISHSGCDSMNVITYFSGYALKTITQTVCIPTAPYYLYIPRNGLCDSVVRVVSILAPAPKLQTLTEFSCFQRQPKLDTLKSVQGCDSVYLTTNFTVRQKLDTTRLSIYVCGLKKPSYNEFKLTNRFGCDSLVIVDSIQVYGKTVQLPLTRTCDKSLSGNFIDTLYTQYGCDSFVKWSVAFVAPTRKVNTSFECDKSKSGVFPHFFQNQYGCDSTIVDSVVYVGSKMTVLPTKEFCGVKNSDTVVDSLYQNIHGCDSLVRQRIIEKESPVIIENSYTHPTSKWNGTASFTVSGGTLPYKWLWSIGSTKTILSGAKGGKYTLTVSDANNCKVTANVNLSDFWISPTGVHGGLADDLLIEAYGSEYGNFKLYNSAGNTILTQDQVPMRDEFIIPIPPTAKGVIYGLMELPNGFLLSIGGKQ